jgi:hypothetical protein
LIVRGRRIIEVARAGERARWAAWLNIWVQVKRALGKKTNPDRKFDHKRMTDAEGHLIRLEDQLALNVAARNSIVQRLFTMPPPVEDLRSGAIEGEKTPPQPDDESPLGWLLRAGRKSKVVFPSIFLLL